MRITTFAKRNFKEIIRDPLSLIFAIGLPLLLLFIFQQIKIPNDIYDINNFTPGIVVFSLSFITLFTAILVSKDRSNSFLIRLSVSPMKSVDYIIGYILALLPLVIIQNILFYLLAIIYNLDINVGIILAIIMTAIISILFILLGILIGSITSDKTSSGVSSIIAQLVAFTSGTYFDTSMMGDFFAYICKILPFEAILKIIKGVLKLNIDNLIMPIIQLLIYITIISVVSIVIFRRQKINNN